MKQFFFVHVFYNKKTIKSFQLYKDAPKTAFTQLYVPKKNRQAEE